MSQYHQHPLCMGWFGRAMQLGNLGQELAVGVGGGYLYTSFLSLPLWETAECKLKYCLSQGDIKPKTSTKVCLAYLKYYIY